MNILHGFVSSLASVIMLVPMGAIALINGLITTFASGSALG
ncbi:hypothetical protein [Nocardia brasiliensis]